MFSVTSSLMSGDLLLSSSFLTAESVFSEMTWSCSNPNLGTLSTTVFLTALVPGFSTLLPPRSLAPVSFLVGGSRPDSMFLKTDYVGTSIVHWTMKQRINMARKYIDVLQPFFLAQINLFLLCILEQALGSKCLFSSQF